MYVQNCCDGMASQVETAHMNWWFYQINTYEVPWYYTKSCNNFMTVNCCLL